MRVVSGESRRPRLRLGVNIDHVATLRQARGTSYPSILEAADRAVRGGAAGITVHLREDRRHIQEADVHALKAHLTVPLNLEMANVPEIVEIALQVKPHEACLVPERREELTTEGGLDVAGQIDSLRPTVNVLQQAGILVSLFIEPDPEQVSASSTLGASYVELHTGTFCEASGKVVDMELERLIRGAEQAHTLQMKVNAGHGIYLDIMDAILNIPYLDTLNVGHSIISRSVFVGLEEAVCEVVEAMKSYGGFLGNT